MTQTAHPELEGLGTYKFGWSDSDAAGSVAKRGLSTDVVRGISTLKNEPEWMLDLRLKGLKLFDRKPMPSWGADLSGIDYDNIKRSKLRVNFIQWLVGKLAPNVYGDPGRNLTQVNVNSGQGLTSPHRDTQGNDAPVNVITPEVLEDLRERRRRSIERIRQANAAEATVK